MESNVYENNKVTKEVTFEESRLMVMLIIIIIPFYLVGDLIYDAIWKGRDPLVDLNIPELIKYLSVLVAIFVHELIHGAIFAYYAPNRFRSVKFGFSKNLGSPYCHCSDPLKVKHYMRAGIAPFVILGVIPYLLALVTGNNWIKVFGLLFCIGGFGDLLVWIKLFKYDKNILVMDHPSKMGFILQ
jgi:hypothetical protein